MAVFIYLVFSLLLSCFLELLLGFESCSYRNLQSQSCSMESRGCLFTATIPRGEPCQCQPMISSVQGQCKHFPSCGKFFWEAIPMPVALKHRSCFWKLWMPFQFWLGISRIKSQPSEHNTWENYTPLNHQESVCVSKTHGHWAKNWNNS